MTLLSHCWSSGIGLSVGAAYLTVGKWFQGEETAGETWGLPRCHSCLFPQVPSPHPIKAHSQPHPSASPRERLPSLCESKHSPICSKSDSCPSGTLCVFMWHQHKEKSNGSATHVKVPETSLRFIVTQGSPLPHTSSPLFISFLRPLSTLPWMMAKEIL